MPDEMLCQCRVAGDGTILRQSSSLVVAGDTIR